MQTVKKCAKILKISEATIYKHIREQSDWGKLFVIRKGEYSLPDPCLKKFPGLRKRVSARGITCERKIGFRVSDDEYKIIHDLAKKAGVTLAEWCLRCSLGTHLTNSGPDVK